MSKEDSCDATAPRLDGPAAGRHAERAGGRSNSADPKLASVYRLAASWAILAMPPGKDGMAGCPSGQRERSVKPSAKPTLVRTQDLPPPAKTARPLRKRGPAGRFLLVTPCIRVCHRGSMHSSDYGHIADSVRAKPAVRITAPFPRSGGRTCVCRPQRHVQGGRQGACGSCGECGQACALDGSLTCAFADTLAQVPTQSIFEHHRLTPMTNIRFSRARCCSDDPAVADRQRGRTVGAASGAVLNPC
jgi:hypothetical protein